MQMQTVYVIKTRCQVVKERIKKALNFNPTAADSDFLSILSLLTLIRVTEKAPEAFATDSSSSEESVPQEQALLFLSAFQMEEVDDGFYIQPQTDAMRPILN